MVTLPEDSNTGGSTGADTPGSVESVERPEGGGGAEGLTIDASVTRIDATTDVKVHDVLSSGTTASDADTGSDNVPGWTSDEIPEGQRDFSEDDDSPDAVFSRLADTYGDDTDEWPRNAKDEYWNARERARETNAPGTPAGSLSAAVAPAPGWLRRTATGALTWVLGRPRAAARLMYRNPGGSTGVGINAGIVVATKASAWLGALTQNNTIASLANAAGTGGYAVPLYGTAASIAATGGINTLQTGKNHRAAEQDLRGAFTNAEADRLMETVVPKDVKEPVLSFGDAATAIIDEERAVADLGRRFFRPERMKGMTQCTPEGWMYRVWTDMKRLAKKIDAEPDFRDELSPSEQDALDSFKTFGTFDIDKARRVCSAIGRTLYKENIRRSMRQYMTLFLSTGYFSRLIAILGIGGSFISGNLRQRTAGHIQGGFGESLFGSPFATSAERDATMTGKAKRGTRRAWNSWPMRMGRGVANAVGGLIAGRYDDVVRKPRATAHGAEHVSYEQMLPDGSFRAGVHCQKSDADKLRGQTVKLQAELRKQQTILNKIESRRKAGTPNPSDFPDEIAAIDEVERLENNIGCNDENQKRIEDALAAAEKAGEAAQGTFVVRSEKAVKEILWAVGTGGGTVVTAGGIGGMGGGLVAIVLKTGLIGGGAVASIPYFIPLSILVGMGLGGVLGFKLATGVYKSASEHKGKHH